MRAPVDQRPPRSSRHPPGTHPVQCAQIRQRRIASARRTTPCRKPTTHSAKHSARPSTSATRIADTDDKADIWDIADGLLAGAVQYWLYSRQPCADPECEECVPISTAEGRIEELRRLMRSSPKRASTFTRRPIATSAALSATAHLSIAALQIFAHKFFVRATRLIRKAA
jgi:hypothetical protein